MKIFAQIRKVDEEKRMVYARAAHSVLDKVGERFRYAESKPYFEEWSKNQFDASAGKSYGNIRAMHGKIAAGILPEPLTFVDDEQAIDAAIKVTDDQEWAKCLDGTYTGLSIGGSYVGERKTEKVDGQDVTWYTAKPAEISLVDSPCIPTCRFFEVVKADGAVEKVDFKAPALEVKGTDAEVAELAKSLNDAGMALHDALELLAVEAMLVTSADIEKREFSADERKDAAKEGAALPDGSFPIKTKGDLANAIKAYGRAKNKAAAKAHIIKRANALGASEMLPEGWTTKLAEGGNLKKGMWSVSTFAGVLSSLADVCRGAQEDFDYEGDNSPVPQKLRNAFGDLVDCFKMMADEEATEMLAQLKAHAGVGPDDEIEEALEAAMRAGTLKKQLSDPDLPFTEFVKIAQNELTAEEFSAIKTSGVAAIIEQILAKKLTAAHMDKMQAIHDHSVSMGAGCTKEAAAAPGAVQKGVQEETDLQKALARIAALEKQPMPHVITLRTVAKGETMGQSKATADALQAMSYDKLIKFADGTIDWKSSESLLQSGAAA